MRNKLLITFFFKKMNNVKPLILLTLMILIFKLHRTEINLNSFSYCICIVLYLSSFFDTTDWRFCLLTVKKSPYKYFFRIIGN